MGSTWSKSSEEPLEEKSRARKMGAKESKTCSQLLSEQLCRICWTSRCLRTERRRQVEHLIIRTGRDKAVVLDEDEDTIYAGRDKAVVQCTNAVIALPKGISYGLFLRHDTMRHIERLLNHQDSSSLDHICTSIKSGVSLSSVEIQTLASVNLWPMSPATCQKYLNILNLALGKFRAREPVATDCIAKCNLNALQDFYIISKDIKKSGSEVIWNAYKNFDSCLKSDRIINILLFMAFEKTVPEHFETILRTLEVENWLQRNVLHIVAIFVEDEKILRLIPNDIIETQINEKDLHGCTPLHVAYLHHNNHAAEFLKSHGAKEDIVDYFGFSPKSLGSRVGVTAENGILKTEFHFQDDNSEQGERNEHIDVAYLELCLDIMNASSGVFEKLRLMLVVSQTEADDMSEELKILFEHIMHKAGYGENFKEVVIAGSLREKLKVGRFDEADVQIRFHHDLPDRSSLNGNLMMSLDKVDWSGINLRPVCVSNPWEFLWEKPGQTQGLTISVDVVPVFEENDTDDDSFRKQGLILKDAQLHNKMYYLKLKKPEEGCCPTYFAFEWDILDSLPMGCRLGILIAKGLLQAYYWANGMQSVSEKPLTSYLVKTALFHILAGDKDAPSRPVRPLGNDGEVNFEAGSQFKRIEFNPSPKWMDDEDMKEYAEEGWIWASRIFDHISDSGYKMKSFWAYPSYIHVDYNKAVHLLQCFRNLLQKQKFY